MSSSIKYIHNKVTTNMNWELNKKRLTGEYIAGFVQADGSFSAVLTSKTRGTKQYFNISLVFTIVQKTQYKNLILEIKNQFDNKGNWIFCHKDKTIKYQITNQNDILNVLIPFFMKYQLRDEKLKSFLRFKYIAEIISTRAHWSNKNILLSLIVIAGQINPSSRLGNKIRYLKPEQVYYVENNIQPEGVDISKLTESIDNFKSNPLTLDFVHGLFETNTNNFRNVGIEDQNNIRDNFLPKNVELWRFKEYYTGLNKTPASKSFKDLGKRSFSSYAKLRSKAGKEVVPPCTKLVKAVKIYINADLDKLRIISENKGKCGIYRWTNLINGNSYIGSSVNLDRRLRCYFSVDWLESAIQKAKSKIYRSLVKNGYSNFSLEILEYCEKSESINREQYYIDLCEPEYNILKIAGSRLNSKHLEETIAKIWTDERKAKRLQHLKNLHASEAHKEHLKKLVAINNSPEQTVRKIERLKIINSNPELQAKRLEQLNIYNYSPEHREHLTKLHERRSFKVEIFDCLNNKTTVYNSVRAAAGEIGCAAQTIHNAIKNLEEKGVPGLIKKRYKAKRIIEG